MRREFAETYLGEVFFLYYNHKLTLTHTNLCHCHHICILSVSQLCEWYIPTCTT